MFTGPNIVTEGLILALDAGNKKSYPGSGNTWTDLSGQGNDGTLVNGVGYSGDNLGSLSFDGSNDYINSPNFDLDDNFSLSVFCWVYSTDFTLGVSSGFYYNWIINKRDNSNDRQWQLYVKESSLQASIMDGTSGVDNITYSNNTLLENKWYYVGFTTEGVSGGVSKVYVNETEVGSGVLSADRKKGNRDLIIGTTAWGLPGSLLWKGNINVSQIYNRALTPQEVLQNYNATKSRFGLT